MEEATERAISAGYRHIDTAYIYQNETAIGRALQKKMADGAVTRDDLFCTTKVLRVRPRHLSPLGPRSSAGRPRAGGLVGGLPAGTRLPRSDFPRPNPAMWRPRTQAHRASAPPFPRP